MFDSRSRKPSPLKSSRLNLTQTISPVKSEHYQSLDEDKKHAINKILYLFIFYSSRISKYSYKQLNQMYFLQLTSDLYYVKNDKKLTKNSLQYKDFSNIYFAKGKRNSGSGIKFQDFLQSLPVISLYLCPEVEQRQQAVKQVVHHLLRLYEIKAAPSIQAQLVEFQQPINEQTKQMILKLRQSFNIVYKIYFGNQVAGKFNTKDPSQQSFDRFMNMMKDFEIFPKLMNAASLYYLYQQTLKSGQNSLIHQTQHIKQTLQEKGQLFTLSKMLQILISCSRICFSKLKNLENPEYDIAYQKQIFKTLLEYMETIKSTKTNLKTSTIFKQNRFSFILLEEYENDQRQKMTKTFIVKDRIIKESDKQMEFFSIFDKIKL